MATQQTWLGAEAAGFAAAGARAAGFGAGGFSGKFAGSAGGFSGDFAGSAGGLTAASAGLGGGGESFFSSLGACGFGYFAGSAAHLAKPRKHLHAQRSSTEFERFRKCILARTLSVPACAKSGYQLMSAWL